jgi:predicted RNA-binding Zn ribbon-like protein
MGNEVRTFELIGGHVVVDYINTVSWRLDDQRRIERVPGYWELLEWARQAQLIDTGQYLMLGEEGKRHPVLARQAATAAHLMREVLYRALAPLAVGEEPTPAARSELLYQILAALQQAQLATVSPLSWNLRVRAPADLIDLLGMRTLELLESGDVASLRQCHDRACGWLFIDRSRSHTRRWCSSTDCGNRERARRHYTRHREPQSDGLTLPEGKSINDPGSILTP